MATALQIQQLYVAYFGRPADPAGLDYWVSTGISTKDFAAAMYAQPEFAQANAGLPVVDQVNALYLNLFGRSGDADGLLYWTQQINSGKLTLASIANDLIFAANNNPSAQSKLDLTALNNKTATAIAYTGDVRETSASLIAYNATSVTPWVTGPQFTSAVNYLATVTQTAPTAAATQASVDLMTAIGPAGQTFTLTTNVDTATANVFNGNAQIVGNFALPTLNTGDALTGSGLNPTINATILVDGTTTTPALLSGIETLNTTFSTLGVAALGAATLNLQSGSSFKTITSANATQAANFTGLNIALENVTVSNTATAQTFTFANAALSGASNAVSLTLNGVTGGNINFNTVTANSSGYETINLVSSGFAANTPGQINAGTNAVAYTTLNISGSAPLTLAAASTTTAVTTVNGSSATGAITYTVPGANSLAFTGGTGNDSIDMAATYTTADTINGGNGTDILLMSPAQAQATTNQTNVTNIENLRLNTADGNGATYQPGLYGGATTLSLQIAQTNAVAGTNIDALAGTGTLDLRTFSFDGAAGAVTVTMAGTATNDVYNLKTSITAAALDIIGGAFNANGVETLNITNSGTQAATIEGAVTLTPTIGGGRNLNILGSAQVILEGNNTFSIFSAAGMTAGGVLMQNALGTTTTVTQLAANITGSGFADRLGGSANSDVISGGAGADVINGNGAADLLTGGAGFDAFNFSVIGAGIAGNTGTLTPATSYSQIADLVVGTTAATSDLFNVAFGVAFTGTAVSLDSADGVAVAAAGAVNSTSVAGGQVLVVADAVNFIKFTNAATTATGATADAAFNSVIGAGTITAVTPGASSDVLAEFYDAANSQAVIGYIVNSDGVITSADQFNVLSTIAMTAADYANFGANQISFAAAANL